MLETYGMLQTAFRPSRRNRASVLEWHKRFKEGRESVRDDERCGRSKEVRTLELIGQIKNFRDKDRRVSIETISAQFDVSVRTVHTIIREELKMRKICVSFSQGCSEKIRKKDVVMTAGRWSSWSIQISQFLLLRWPAMKAGSIAMTQRPRNRVPSGSMLALPDPRRSDRANPPTNVWWSLFLKALAWSTCNEFPLDRQSTRNTILRFYGSSGKDSVGRGQHSSNRVSGISTKTMHQFTTPSLSQTIWPRWASRQLLSLPIVQTLLPVTFAYSLSSRKNLEAVVMRQLRRWKRLWRWSLTCSHKRTSMRPPRSCWNGTPSALQLEEITSKGTRISCVYYQ